MTNRNFFKSVFDDGLKLGHSDFEIRSNSHLLGYYKFSVIYHGNFLPLIVYVSLSNRSIITDILYTDLNLCKYSPFELREWCPAIFLPYTNYLHWQKILLVALEIFVDTNPKLF